MPPPRAPTSRHWRLRRGAHGDRGPELPLARLETRVQVFDLPRKARGKEVHGPNMDGKIEVLNRRP